MKTNNLIRNACFFVLFFCTAFVLMSCDFGSGGDSDKIISSRAYSGHESDMDANNFVAVYPTKAGTRLDDCQTCHSGGTLEYKAPYKKDIDGQDIVYSKVDNACNWCHYIPFPDTSGSFTEVGVFDTSKSFPFPKRAYDTLNSYGKAYFDSGRSADALRAIASLDSDGDGASNAAEIKDNRFPGNALSKPGQPIAALKEMSWIEVTAITQQKQFMMMNTAKQQYDDYVNYTGVTIKELLKKAGVNVDTVQGITGITVFAPDGFKMSFTLADINDTFPEAKFYKEPGLNYMNSDALLDCTTYPADTHGLNHGGVIGADINPQGLRMILAYQREGTGLSVSYYDGLTGRLEGEGPYRLVIPQRNGTGFPGKPDRGSKSKKATNASDTYNYVQNFDHNAGFCNRGACVIRIDPMPAGYEEFDTTNGWSLIKDKKIVIYGKGIN